MAGAVEVLRHEFAGLRTGRASVSLLDPVKVIAYDTEMPLNQVATIAIADPRMLSVQVWDKSLVKAVERAIWNADLGLNPVVDGQMVRVPIPELNEERRTELVKVAGKYAEQAKVAVRNIRRDGKDELKKLEKEGELSQDGHRKWAEEVQQLTDKTVETISEMFVAKQKEIMQV